jgi:hypothetical protein
LKEDCGSTDSVPKPRGVLCRDEALERPIAHPRDTVLKTRASHMASWQAQGITAAMILGCSQSGILLCMREAPPKQRNEITVLKSSFRRSAKGTGRSPSFRKILGIIWLVR